MKGYLSEAYTNFLVEEDASLLWITLSRASEGIVPFILYSIKIPKVNDIESVLMV